MKKLAAIAAAAVLLCGCTDKQSGADTPKPSETSPAVSESGKTIVNIAALGPVTISELSDPLNMPQDIDVKITDYGKGADDLTAAFRNLKSDVLYGECPDIVILDPDNIVRLENAGGLADLGELMDGYDGIKREDFLPNVIDGFTLNGRIPGLSEAFTIKTAMAKTKFVPAEYENWTPAQATEFYNDLPDGMEFMELWSTDELAQYMLWRVQFDCVDTSAWTCDFTAGSFIDTLRFCSEQQLYAFEPDFESMTDSERAEFSLHEELKGVSDEYLVFPVDISDFGSGLAQMTYGFLGMEDFTFVGYPSDSGNGTITYTEGSNIHHGMYGIPQRSGAKEQAWELLSFIIGQQPKLEKNAMISTGIPVLMEQLDRDYRRSVDYSNSINRSFSLPGALGSENYSPDDPDMNGTLSQEQKDRLHDYILSVKFEPYASLEIRALASMETAAVLAGDMSAEQCAVVLNDRIGTYLSEKE
ncbi:MAG: extracellular solute-binding protein [Ruminococcus sp.]|nr:extracellular solute-binding protein [Ruminococcus sp.]